ncbi:unnamed protein product, partial [Laminaria digitata]
RESPALTKALSWYAILGCAIFAISILIADFVVPNHDWISDTISDLGAGKFEFIVDIGIYAFSASLISIALLASHIHLGRWPWSVGVVGFAVLGLIVFLVGARNEYGDGDSDGVVIHIYLVYALGFLFAALPLAMARDIDRIGRGNGWLLISLSALWIISAPVFFFLPDSIDGIYERYLGLIAFAITISMARIFIRRASALQRRS